MARSSRAPSLAGYRRAEGPLAGCPVAVAAGPACDVPHRPPWVPQLRPPPWRPCRPPERAAVAASAGSLAAPIPGAPEAALFHGCTLLMRAGRAVMLTRPSSTRRRLQHGNVDSPPQGARLWALGSSASVGAVPDSAATWRSCGGVRGTSGTDFLALVPRLKYRSQRSAAGRVAPPQRGVRPPGCGGGHGGVRNETPNRRSPRPLSAALRPAASAPREWALAA